MSLEPRTDRAVLLAGRILPLVAGGKFVRVSGDAARACVLMLARGVGERNGVQEAAHNVNSKLHTRR